jgi:hypothetical protein
MNRVVLAVSLAATIGAGAALAQAQKPSTDKPAAEKPAHAASATHGATAAGHKDDAAIIASAMKAAPPAVARHATIVEMDAKGGMRVVRKGAGNFTCMPDDPTTPGADPMCMDKNAMAWGEALMTRKPPPQKVGFMYMLAGGTDASNTDPFAKAPSKANHWVKTGPHVMVVGSPEILAGYPAGADPDTTQPYVMWAGTPYAHLMIPVH